MEIRGKCVVKVVERKGKRWYSTNISHRNMQGDWENTSVYMQFAGGQGEELKNKAEIEVTKGFISMYKDGNGEGKLKFIIQEYKETREEEGKIIGVVEDIGF